MTRYILSTEDGGPNVLFSGSQAELVSFVSTRWQQGASNSRPLPPQPGTDGKGVEPKPSPAARASAPPARSRPCAACGHDPSCGFASVSDRNGERWYCHDDDHSCYTPAPPAYSDTAYVGQLQRTDLTYNDGPVSYYSVSLSDRPEDWAWPPVCDLDGWEGTE